MYVLVTYDVVGADVTSARRLRRIAKVCTQYGQRVQLSVFKCLLEPAQYEAMKHELEKVIDVSKDSLRFYILGKNWHNRVEIIGVQNSYDPEDVLIL